MAFYKDPIKVLEELKEKYPNYDYSKFKYSKMREKCIIICPEHGEFYPTVINFKNGSGCPKCSKKISRIHTKSTSRLMEEDVIKRFKKIHGDKYNYSKVKYINRSTKVKIICNSCGNKFDQIPSSHLNGYGCSKCSKMRASKKRINITNNTKNIINEFKKVHGDKYNYSKVNYIDSNTKVEIICSKHGSFWQLPGSHKARIGCPKCGILKNMTTPEKNIINFKKVHGDKYDYTLLNNNTNLNSLIPIICPEHGEFLQTKSNHLQGHGCSKCTCTRSKTEEEIYNFIKYNHPELEIIQNHKIGRMELDIYIPELNFAIEYNGVYWHSYMHPDKATSKNQTDSYYNKKRHLKKFEACTQLGIHLFQINELEFSNPIKKDIWLSKILLKLGKIPNKISGRKCIIKEVSKKESREFQELNHLQGAINSQKHYGLYYQDELVQIFTLGASRYNKNFEYEIHRICTKKNTIVHGGVSKLFKHVLNELDNPKIITYANRRWSALNNSNLYKQLGLEYVKESSPNFEVIDLKNNKIYKRGSFQKHKLENIPNFNYNPSLTAMNNIINNDYIIQWDAGNGVYIKNK